MSAIDIERFRQDLREARTRLAPLLGRNDGQFGHELLVELQTAHEELRVAEEEMLIQYDELQGFHSLGQQQLWRYEALFDTAPLPYLTTDINAMITEVNGHAQYLFGRGADRLVGTPLAMLVDAHHRREFRLAVNRLATHQGVAELALELHNALIDHVEVTATVATGVTASGEPEFRWILHPMATTRRRDLLAKAVKELTTSLTDTDDIDELLTMLCEHAASIVGAATCGVLLADEAGSLQTIAASDQSTELLELFQIQYGEGPCFDAFRTNDVVLVDDLHSEAGRWPGFAQLARQRRLRSVLSVPLRVGSDAIGALNLLHRRVAAFSDSDVLAAETLAGLAAFGISFGRTLDRTQETVVQLQHALDSRVIIEQAKGMLAERAGVAPQVAFEMLRGHARGNGRMLKQTCKELVDGTLPVEALESVPRRV